MLAVAYCALTCAGLAQSASSASWNQASRPGFASGCFLASSFSHFLEITRISSHGNLREARIMFPFWELVELKIDEPLEPFKIFNTPAVLQADNLTIGLGQFRPTMIVKRWAACTRDFGGWASTNLARNLGRKGAMNSAGSSVSCDEPKTPSP